SWPSRALRDRPPRHAARIAPMPRSAGGPGPRSPTNPPSWLTSLTSRVGLSRGPTHPCSAGGRAPAQPPSVADRRDLVGDQARPLAELLQAQAEDVPDGQGHLADV